MEHVFKPFPFIENPHLMTVFATLRRADQTIIKQGELRLFDVDSQSKIATYINKRRNKMSSVMIIVHGLEGSASSPQVVGLAGKVLDAGIDVVRLNLRNCGGTLHLSNTLYNAGQSSDLIAVAKELKERDGIDEIFLAGYSLGGNIVLKATAELASKAKEYITAAGVISPAVDLAQCVQSIEKGVNRFYEQHFLTGLKGKLRAKHKLFPGRYNIANLNSVRTLRDFDNRYTAPDAGYISAENYYKNASALPIVDQIRIPTLIIASADDPIVPVSSFQSEKLDIPYIRLVQTRQGGHGGFIQHHREVGNPFFDRFFAENRLVEFCLAHSRLSVA